MKPFKFLISLAVPLLLAALFGTAVAPALGISTGTAVLATTVLSLGLGSILPPQVGVLNTITINAGTLYDQFNEFYQNLGQNMSSLFKAMQKGRDFPNLARTIYHDSDLFVAAETEMSALLKPFVAAFAHKGDLTVDPIEIPLRRMKFDQLITPDSFRGTFLGFMETLGEGDRSKWPAVRYILEMEVAPKIGEELDAADWAGVYNASGTTNLDVFNGVRELLRTGITGGSINEITLTNDLADATKAVEGVEEFCDGLPNFWRKSSVDIVVPDILYKRYFRDYRASFGANQNYTGQVQDLSPDAFPNWKLKAWSAMDTAGDTTAIFATPTGNLARFVRQGSYNVDMTRDARQVKLFGDWQESPGFLVNSMVYAANVAASGS